MKRLTILGSGAAPGVPSLGRGWGVCDPENVKNRRSPDVCLFGIWRCPFVD